MSAVRRYYGSLQVSSVSPPTGPAAGGTPIRIDGGQLRFGSEYRCCLDPSQAISPGGTCGTVSMAGTLTADGGVLCTTPSVAGSGAYRLRVSLNGMQYSCAAQSRPAAPFASAPVVWLTCRPVLTHHSLAGRPRFEPYQSLAFWVVQANVHANLGALNPSVGPVGGGTTVNVEYSGEIQSPTLPDPLDQMNELFVETSAHANAGGVTFAPKCRFGAATVAATRASPTSFSCTAPTAAEANASIGAIGRSEPAAQHAYGRGT